MGERDQYSIYYHIQHSTRYLSCDMSSEGGYKGGERDQYSIHCTKYSTVQGTCPMRCPVREDTREGREGPGQNRMVRVVGEASGRLHCTCTGLYCTLLTVNAVFCSVYYNCSVLYCILWVKCSVLYTTGAVLCTAYCSCSILYCIL